MNGVPVFTAAQIAAALGVSSQAIRQRLEHADATKARVVLVRGQAATAWPVEALPADIQTRLAVLAERQNSSDVSQLLSNPPKRWQPEIPLPETAPRQVEAATARRNVLAPILRNRGNAFMSELVRQAQNVFKRLGGWNRKCDRTVQRWITAALERNRGLDEWERVELYLDEHPDRRSRPSPSREAAQWGLTHFQDALESLEDSARPTAKDIHSLWTAIMLEIDEQTEVGIREGRVRKVIVRALHNSGIRLASTLPALLKAIQRKRKDWLTGERKPSAIADKRPPRSGNRASRIPKEDHLEIVASTLKHGGRVSEGFREALDSGKLSATTVQRHIANPASKSYVPQRIRDAVTHDTKLLMDLRHGPRQAELNGAHLDRDWSAVAPGDWWQGDDLTAPVYYWEETPDGVFFGRGQLLMMIDLRTTFILGWLLHSDNTYNARIIRSLITKCHDAHGLPRRGFYFERGLWKTARLLAGSQGNAVPWRDTELGLREYCEFRHAQLPRGKVIERVFGLVQNQMEHLTGYVGRDERHDRYERVERQIRDVQAARVHPSASFFEKTQLMTRYQQIFLDYNRTPQNGKMLAGVSPQEMYEVRKTDDIMQLDARTRYLLANHRMPVKITANGIRLPKSMGGGLYRNGQTGERIGQRMLVWVDVDNLQAISVTDINCREAFVVERADPVPAMDASPEELARAMAQRDAHNGYAQALYRVIEPRLKDRPYRPVVADRQSVALGQAMAEQASQQKRERMSYAHTQKTVQEMEREFKVAPAPNNDPTMADRLKRGMELMKEALRSKPDAETDERGGGR